MATTRKLRTRWGARRALITLSLSNPQPVLPPPSLWRREPEITETEILLKRLARAHDGLRVVHLTDIHHSLWTRLRVVRRTVHLANALEPDVVALTGDYVTFSPACVWPVARALGRLRARLGVFAVLGNHDFQVGADEMARALRAQGIHVLRNYYFALRAGGAALWMVGIDDPAVAGWSADDLERALHHVPGGDCKVLLCHNPLGIHLAARKKIDLVLSGHTHGGQIRLPVVGSVHGRSKLGERFVDGWNRLDGTQIYVSRGIGVSVVPLRVGCPPEITCLRLRRAE